MIFWTFNILCQTLELGFYWAHKLDILQQFDLDTKFIDSSSSLSFRKRECYLGEHADNVGVEGVLLVELRVRRDGVAHGNRSFPLSVPAYY